MSNALYTQLRWLPKPDESFRAKCKEVIKDDTANGESIAWLAGHALDENNLRRVTDVITTFRKQGRRLAPLAPFKLGLVGNGTLDGLVPAIVASGARHGIALDCIKADFGQVMQEALAPDSAINRAHPDAVLIALDHRGLPLKPDVFGADDAQRAVREATSVLNAIREGFHTNCGAPCIVQTLAPPPEATFGSLDSAISGSQRSLIRAFNDELVKSVANGQDVLFDVASLAETVGLADWHSPTLWNIGKFSFDASMLPLYADHVGRLLGAVRGKARKCLVLDLDNTVWGGVIGDDGLEGIVLGQGDATGEAHLQVQQTALMLRERGIVLAISSKNTDEIARTPFRQHPEMLLKEEHIAVFQANWNDKATNLAAIAKELSLGIDSLVFLDDNPVERELVRRLLPRVAVPELPEDPALYARTLLAAGYFEAVAFSEEDRKRADFYAGNARRAALQSQVGDVSAYLASLQMKITFSPFDATGRSRIAQLINKSNQFNLTTRRYTETEVAAFESEPAFFTLQVRLADIFGDNGMIGVIICREVEEPAEWEIDTWLMSCRVLGRNVEQMVLREILEHARMRGIRSLVGKYIPTEKNALVKDHYRNLGFELVTEEDSGKTIWRMSTDADIEAAPMVVERIGFELQAAS